MKKTDRSTEIDRERVNQCEEAYYSDHKNATELVFILDRSGSMNGLEADTTYGFNSMLEKQRQVPGDCRITTVLFDHERVLLHDRFDIEGVEPMTKEQYQVRGTTALLDAIGFSIQRIERVQTKAKKKHRAKNVLFVIITDGLENASREFTAKQVKRMIEKHKEVDGWEFVFLGANIDAVKTAKHYGIGMDRAVDFHADSEGVEKNFQVMSKTVSHYRMHACMPENWDEEIQDDYQGRKRS